MQPGYAKQLSLLQTPVSVCATQLVWPVQGMVPLPATQPGALAQSVAFLSCEHSTASAKFALQTTAEQPEPAHVSWLRELQS